MHRKSEVAFEAGVVVGCDSGPDLLFGCIGEEVVSKIDLLETSLLSDQLYQKVDVGLSLLSFEPGLVAFEVEFSD